MKLDKFCREAAKFIKLPAIGWERHTNYWKLLQVVGKLGSVLSREELSIDEPARLAIKQAGSAVGNSVIAICTIYCYSGTDLLYPQTSFKILVTC